MKFRIPVVLLLVVIVSSVSCKSISEQAKEDLAKPINCATAAEDIATLESEKANAVNRIADGVSDVYPPLAVIGILGGKYKERGKVAIGGYNTALEAKIAEIKQSCGIE